MRRPVFYLGGVCVAALLLGACEGASLLAEGGSSSRLNLGLSLSLDIFRFEKKPPNPAKIPPPTLEPADATDEGEAP